MSERILIIRLGALGDTIGITPLLRYLKQQGNEIYFNTSENGMLLLRDNPHIDKFIDYSSNSIPNEKLGEYWSALQKSYECDNIINLCEVWEVELALHPADPCYNWSKQERFNKCNKNYYEYIFTRSGYDFNGVDLTPELHFTEEETLGMLNFFNQYKGKRVIILGLSGSGRNKCYPFVDFLIGDILVKYTDTIVITVGDEVCQILELFEHPRVIRKSGVWNIRQAMLATKYANLVISPDTGLLHASGCYDTPKIGLLGSTTIENITKHFKNDYSLEADCPCSPCFRLILNAETQCPIDNEVTGACLCMSRGMPKEKVFSRVCEVLDKI